MPRVRRRRYRDERAPATCNNASVDGAVVMEGRPVPGEVFCTPCLLRWKTLLWVVRDCHHCDTGLREVRTPLVEKRLPDARYGDSRWRA